MIDLIVAMSMYGCSLNNTSNELIERVHLTGDVEEKQIPWKGA